MPTVGTAADLVMAGLWTGSGNARARAAAGPEDEAPHVCELLADVLRSLVHAAHEACAAVRGALGATGHKSLGEPRLTTNSAG